MGRKKSIEIITNKNKPGFEGNKNRYLDWKDRKEEIRLTARRIHPMAWDFFVRAREQGYLAGKCTQEAYEDALEETIEHFSQGWPEASEVPDVGQ